MVRKINLPYSWDWLLSQDNFGYFQNGVSTLYRVYYLGRNEAQECEGLIFDIRSNNIQGLLRVIQEEFVMQDLKAFQCKCEGFKHQMWFVGKSEDCLDHWGNGQSFIVHRIPKQLWGAWGRARK